MTEIKTLSKGLKALKIISESDIGIGTTELSNCLSTDKSSASRIIKTLEKQDFIRKKNDSRKYVIGSKLFSLTNLTRIVFDLSQFSKASLIDLVNKTGECAHIAVLCEQRALYFDKHDTNLSLKVDHPIGTLAPLHSTALGKILITYNHINLYDYYSKNKNLTKDITVLSSEIEQVKTHGYSIDDEEYEEGIRCIAAPIYHIYQDRVSAIGISGPTKRIKHDKINYLSDIIVNIAKDISLNLKSIYEKNL